MMQWQAFMQLADRGLRHRMTVVAAVLGFGLALGACSKCDVPNWLSGQPGPHACHGAPSPQ
jgi:hypothetical protein